MSITSLCSNCPDTVSDIIYGSFNINFNILKDLNSVINIPFGNINIPLLGYSIEEFSIEPSEPLPAVPTIVPLIYGNMVGPAQEVKLLMIVPTYENSVLNIEWEKNLQWRFVGSTIWSNIGPFMILTGSENDPNFIGNSNKIGTIEFRNLTSEKIKIKVIIGI